MEAVMNEHQHHTITDTEGPSLFEFINKQIAEHADDCAKNMPRIYVTWVKAIGIMAAIAMGAAGATWIVTSQIGDLKSDIKLIQYKTSYTASKIDTVINKGGKP
jgi:hypothetical protein